jgi:acyl-coenzyme A thioesterase PaaI-like protein
MAGVLGLATGSGENAAASLRRAWELLQHVPFGKQIFSKAIGRAAPYTGSIDATVLELGTGRAVVALEDRRSVRNHLKCIHAIALANLAEFAGNSALAFSMPSNARFIVAGMSIDYRKKARGRILAEATCPTITNNERAEYEVSIVMRDAAADVVAESKLKTLVGPQRG